MEFLKKHYEKMILCVVLLGLAAAVLWMKSATEKAKEKTSGDVPSPPRSASVVPPIDLSTDEIALAQITNPPSVVLSGEHNTFNPVTWKRKPNGDLLKILKTGPDALVVTKIVPLYTVISYLRPEEGPMYVMGVQRDLDLTQPNPPRPKPIYPHKDEKNTNWPIMVIGTKGAPNDPSEINLQMLDTGDTNIWVSTNNPYKYVQAHWADLRYDPESKTLSKKRVKDEITLDNDPYIIVEITNDAITVESRRTTKKTEIKWTKSPKGD